MKPVMRVDGENANAVEGRVDFDAKKAAWNLGMIGGSLVFAPLTVSLDSVLVFVVLTYTGLLLGHSVGIHRFMIHRTFRANMVGASTRLSGRPGWHVWTLRRYSHTRPPRLGSTAVEVP